jgi:DNA-directed DNA polymerase III PolC
MRVRTGYSFRVAAGMPEDVMSRLVEISYGCAPITDRASTFGFSKWTKLAGKAGLKPIYGVEIAVSPSIHAKKPVVDYWTFIAIDDIAAINRLLYVATNQFRYEPILSYEQANEAQGVFKIVGHRSIVNKIVDDGHTYVGLSPSVSKGYFNAVQGHGLPFIACSDNRYVRQEDKVLYETIVGVDASNQTYPQYILNPEEWRAAVSQHGNKTIAESALENFSKVESMCNARLKKGTLLSPHHTKTLREMCIEGASKLGVVLDEEVYGPRLDRELKLIADKNFEDYFYIIADLMQWARPQMLCGPARGSSCGSLACYLLQITTIDPIKYDLLFERFIDITRNDLPDIDIDFSEQNRHLAFEYLERKYGAEHVARLGTVALYKSKSAMNEALAAMGAPKWAGDRVMDILVDRDAGDERALMRLEDTIAATKEGNKLIDEYPGVIIAARMEGHPRHYSQHAAGVIITDKPILEYVAVDARTGATHCDKKDAEDLNLLKIDALGLKQLSIFEDALSMAGLPPNHLETVPLDDRAAFEVFNTQKFSGVFQFNGAALQSICRQIKINSLEDIISVGALGRPGPMSSGGTQEWVRRKNGAEVLYPHPAFEPYLKKTLGVVAYQEQVMQICRHIGDMPWEDVSIVRKAISKSMGAEFLNKYRDKFKTGAARLGLSNETLEKIWQDLVTFGSYGFNRSHAVAYAIMSYWCAYAKAHHPFEFAAATLTHEPDPEKQIKLLREMTAEGINYVPVDRELSVDRWVSGVKDGKRVLVGPLQNIKGIGPQAVQQIMGSRLRGEPLPARFDKFMKDAKTEIDTLNPIKDAINRLMPDARDKNIFTPPKRVAEVRTTGEEHSVLIIGVLQQIKQKDENEPAAVAKRRGRIMKGPTQSLGLWVADDSDKIYAKVDRFNFDEIGRPILERGGAGKAIYALKGSVPPDFRMISIKQARFIGFMDQENAHKIT